MYTDAYSAMISEGAIGRAAGVAAELRRRRPLRTAESCAREAAGGVFCPCLAGASGCCDDGACLRTAIVAEIANRMAAPERSMQ